MDNNSNQQGDVEIIERVLGGDVNAFEPLLTKHKDHVLRIVAKHVPYNQIEETAHDVFVRVYQSLPSFNNKSGFKPWLSAIAVRTCYDFWRKHYKSRELPISSLSENHNDWLEKVTSDHSTQSFNRESSQKEARELLDWALDRLSAEERMVLELVYLEGYTVKEAAELLGWSVANVKVRSFRSRKKLKKLITGLNKGYKGEAYERG